MQSLPPEVREAKFVGLAALRAEMYDRNLQVGRLFTFANPCEACRPSLCVVRGQVELDSWAEIVSAATSI